MIQRRSRTGLVLAALVGTTGAACALFERPAMAQEDGMAPPAKVPGKEPIRVLKTLVAILEATDKQDPRSAVAGLRDPHWAVRKFAAIRLATLKLPDEVVRALSAQAVAGSPAPAKDDANVVAAEAWLATFKADPEVKGSGETPTVADEGMRIYGSLVRTELSIKKAPPRELVRVVADLPAYAEAANDARAAGFAAREVATMVDTDQLLKDLGVKTVNEAVAENGKQVFDWLKQNERYLYYHPGDHGLRVDLGARSAGETSDAFRAKNAWKADEGPASPANPKRREIR